MIAEPCSRSNPYHLVCSQLAANALFFKSWAISNRKFQFGSFWGVKRCVGSACSGTIMTVCSFLLEVCVLYLLCFYFSLSSVTRFAFNILKDTQKYILKALYCCLSGTLEGFTSTSMFFRQGQWTDHFTVASRLIHTTRCVMLFPEFCSGNRTSGLRSLCAMPASGQDVTSFPLPIMWPIVCAAANLEGMRKLQQSDKKFNYFLCAAVNTLTTEFSVPFFWFCWWMRRWNRIVKLGRGW